MDGVPKLRTFDEEGINRYGQRGGELTSLEARIVGIDTSVQRPSNFAHYEHFLFLSTDARYERALVAFWQRH
eukprot:scaffold718_cov342-Pavlova_lutheri.AAC.40